MILRILGLFFQYTIYTTLHRLVFKLHTKYRKKLCNFRLKYYYRGGKYKNKKSVLLLY